MDNGFRGRANDQRLFEFLAAAPSDYCDFRGKAFDMFRFFLQKTLRYEKGKVSIAGAGFFDSAIQLVSQRLPDREAVGAKNDTTANRRIIGQLGLQNDVVIPSRKIRAARGYFLLVPICHLDLEPCFNPVIQTSPRSRACRGANGFTSK